MSRTLHLTVVDEPLVKPSEMVRAALGYISNPDLWARGDFFDGDGSCALGAFARTSVQEHPLCINTEEFNAMMDVLFGVLRESLPDIDASTIDEFNDHPDVRHEDIVAAFEKTAAFFEEKGR